MNTDTFLYGAIAGLTFMVADPFFTPVKPWAGLALAVCVTVKAKRSRGKSQPSVS